MSPGSSAWLWKSWDVRKEGSLQGTAGEFPSPQALGHEQVLSTLQSHQGVGKEMGGKRELADHRSWKTLRAFRDLRSCSVDGERV